MSSKLDPKMVFYAVLGLGLIYVVKKTADTHCTLTMATLSNFAKTVSIADSLQ